MPTSPDDDSTGLTSLQLSLEYRTCSETKYMRCVMSYDGHIESYSPLVPGMTTLAGYQKVQPLNDHIANMSAKPSVLASANLLVCAIHVDPSS